MNFFVSENNIYLTNKYSYFHIDKNEFSYSCIKKNKNIFKNMVMNKEFLVIDAFNDMFLRLLKSEDNTNHYLIEENFKHSLYFMDEKNFIDLYEKNYQIDFVAKRNIISLYSKKLGITRDIYSENSDKNDVMHIINKNNERKYIKWHELFIMLTGLYDDNYLEHCFRNNKLKIMDANNKLIIIIENKFMIYDLSIEKIIDHINVEKFVENIFNKLHFVHKLNNHHYFTIIELRDEEYLCDGFNKIIDDNNACVWTIISKTLDINYYFDTCFKFN